MNRCPLSDMLKARLNGMSWAKAARPVYRLTTGRVGLALCGAAFTVDATTCHAIA
jgi:hypothetical protein